MSCLPLNSYQKHVAHLKTDNLYFLVLLSFSSIEVWGMKQEIGLKIYRECTYFTMQKPLHVTKQRNLKSVLHK